MLTLAQNPEASPTPCWSVCGPLLAWLRPDGLEVRCRRCKRVTFIPVADLQGPRAD